jgi:hypothetical protein
MAPGTSAHLSTWWPSASDAWTSNADGLHQQVGRHRARDHTHDTTPDPNPAIEKRSIEADGTMKVERTIILPANKPETTAQVF